MCLHKTHCEKYVNDKNSETQCNGEGNYNPVIHVIRACYLHCVILDLWPFTIFFVDLVGQIIQFAIT